jgi:hypothetical protein
VLLVVSAHTNETGMEEAIGQGFCGTSENYFNANFGECPKGELRRIPIPRTPVNKGKKKAGTFDSPGSLTSGLPTLAVYLAYDVALYTPTSPAVT